MQIGIFVIVIVLSILLIFYLRNSTTTENYYPANVKEKSDVVNYATYQPLQDPVSNNVDNPVSTAAQCRGGSSYMWQSNDPISLKCQQLAQTPQGKFEISKYNCMNAYDGAPLKEFVYTPKVIVIGKMPEISQIIKL